MPATTVGPIESRAPSSIAAETMSIMPAMGEAERNALYSQTVIVNFFRGN